MLKQTKIEVMEGADKFGSKLPNSLSVAVPQAQLAVCGGIKMIKLYRGQYIIGLMTATNLERQRTSYLITCTPVWKRRAHTERRVCREIDSLLFTNFSNHAYKNLKNLVRSETVMNTIKISYDDQGYRVKPSGDEVGRISNKIARTAKI